MNRDQARIADARFYTGPTCPLGHTRRYTTSGHCVECKSNSVKTSKPYHQKPAPQAKPAMPEPHVIQSDWMKSPTKQQLMARR